MESRERGKLGAGGHRIDMKNEPVRGFLIRFIPLLLPIGAMLVAWGHAPLWTVGVLYGVGIVVWLVAGASSFRFGKQPPRTRP